MPFLNGKRVTNKEWKDARGDTAATWREAFGYKDPSDVEPEPEPEAEKPKRRGRPRKQQTVDAVAAVTGLDISLDDEGEDEISEESE